MTSLIIGNERNQHIANMRKLARVYGNSNVEDCKFIILTYLMVKDRYNGRPLRGFVPIFVMREAEQLLSRVIPS